MLLPLDKGWLATWHKQQTPRKPRDSLGSLMHLLLTVLWRHPGMKLCTFGSKRKRLLFSWGLFFDLFSTELPKHSG